MSALCRVSCYVLVIKNVVVYLITFPFLIAFICQNELATHRKKIEEVEAWLKDHIFQRQPKQVEYIYQII